MMNDECGMMSGQTPGRLSWQRCSEPGALATGPARKRFSASRKLPAYRPSGSFSGRRGTRILLAACLAALLLAVLGHGAEGEVSQAQRSGNAERAQPVGGHPQSGDSQLQTAGNAERAQPAWGQPQQAGDRQGGISHLAGPIRTEGAESPQAGDSPGAVSLSLDSGASVVWDTDARGRPSEFIIRIAEFSPDRRFEWESRAQQGTIRIPARVLREGKTFTFAKLFDNGVDIEQADFLTLWLSETIYRELKREGRSRVMIDALKDEFLLQETLPYTLKLDRQAVPVSALKVIDGRGATWLFLDSPENPVMLEFQNRYFHQKIRSMTTRGNILRWIRR